MTGENRASKTLIFLALAVLCLIVAGVTAVMVGAPYASAYLTDWLTWAESDAIYSKIILACFIGFLVFTLIFFNSLFHDAAKLVSARKPKPQESHEPMPQMMAVPLVISPVAKPNSEAELPQAAMPQPTVAAQSAPESRPQADFAPPYAHASDFGVEKNDPLARALLSEAAPLPVRQQAQTDIDSVVHSALQFINAQDEKYQPKSMVQETHAAQMAPQAPAPVESVAPVATYIRPVETILSAPQLPTMPPIDVSPSARETTPAPPVTPAAPILANEDPAVIAKLDELPVLEEIPLLHSGFVSAPASVIPAVIEQRAEILTHNEPSHVPVAPAVFAPVIDESPESQIDKATTMALSVWPDNVRQIAADELKRRLTILFHNPAPEAKRAFGLIETGELNAAALTLQSFAETLKHQSLPLAAAEIWRIFGALHMGRDDGRAISAYEQVSQLDAHDSNIHVYLMRRYQMNNDTAKLPAIMERALGSITDETLRQEILSSLSDLYVKAENYSAASKTLEDLSRLLQARVVRAPDNIADKSAYGISLARLAQTREQLGVTSMAGPLYKMAHEVFSDLSQRLPDHAGLKVMRDSALNDAKRLQFA